MVDSAGAGTVRAVGRAIEILDSFSTSGSTRLSVAEIVKSVDLPRTTVLRLVDTLISERMLDALPDGSISIGPRMARWADFAGAAWAMPDAAQERMARAAAATGETVSVYVRQGTRRLALAQAPGPHSLRHVVQIGDLLPLWRGASALVLLSLANQEQATPDALDALHADAARPDFDPVALSQRVRDTRERGWAVTHGEREPGISGVAVPLARSPYPVALAVGGPTTRFTDERVREFVTELQEAAREIRSTGLPPAIAEH